MTNYSGVTDRLTSLRLDISIRNLRNTTSIKKTTKKLEPHARACDASHLHIPASDFRQPQISQTVIFLIILHSVLAAQTHISRKD